MSEHNFKPAYYDYPLYMRIFPFLRNDEYGYNPRHLKRDAFEDYLTLYSAFVIYGLVRPNNPYGGYYYW